MKTTMYSRIDLRLVALALVLFVSACGARSTNEYGLNEATGVILVGARVEGLRVQLDGDHFKTVNPDDVSRRLGTWTARRNQSEKMQRALIEMPSGRHDLQIYSGGTLILSKSVYLSEAQKLEVVLPDGQR